VAGSGGEVLEVVFEVMMSWRRWQVWVRAWRRVVRYR